MPDREQSYSPEEISQLMREAAELQHADATVSPGALGLSLHELKQAAAEAGIDPRYVAEAAARRQRQPAAPPPADGLFGPPTRYDRSVVVDGHAGAADFPAYRTLIRQAMGHDDDDTPRQARRPTPAAPSFTWDHGTLNQIKVTPAGKQTEIHARGRWGSIAKAYYGGLAAAAFFAGLFVNGVLEPGALGAAGVFVAMMGTGFVAARMLWTRWARRARGRLDAALQAVARHASEGSSTTTAALQQAEQTERAPGAQLELPDLQDNEAPVPDAQQDQDPSRTPGALRSPSGSA